VTPYYHSAAKLVPLYLAALLHASVAAPPKTTTPDDAAETTPGRVALARALELALSRNPRLSAGAASVRAAEARQHQAAMLPNPELEAEVEDVGLTGEERGFDASIYTLRVEQTLELGEKREKRRRAAAVQTDIAAWHLRSTRLDLIAEVKVRFIDLLAAQERLRVVEASHELGRKVRNTAAERVKSGKVAALELTKANVELTGRRVELRRAERQLASAQTALAALWNATPANAASLRAEGTLLQVPELPDRAALEARLGGSPELARCESEEDLALAVVAREKAVRIPDVTLSAGISHERDSGNERALLAVSLPLPLFDRNQGNIAAARAEVDRAREKRRATEVQLRAELAGQWQQLQTALQETTAIRKDMLPGALEAFAAAEEAYRSGKLEYLDVLDAQETLFEAEMQLLDALTALHQTLTAIERLVGGGLRE